MPESTGRHLIVTGGTGYIGQRVVELALGEGRKVTLIGRTPGPAGTRHLPWELGEPLPAAAIDSDLPPSAQAVVHLAHDWHDETGRNVEGSRRLFEAGRAAGLGPGVFVSSQSAREQALNRYGRLKWAIERQVGDAACLRVGLVYGGPTTAMYGLLCRITRLPFLPMIDPHRPVQPIHRDEVARGILAAIDRSLCGVLALAGPVPLPFGELLKTLARAYRGRRLPILPVPLRLALLGCAATVRLPFLPTVDRERVLGLAGTEPIDAADDLARLGLVVVPLARGLAREPEGRRALLREAHAFLRHAGGRPPRPALAKRYARAFPGGAIARPHLPLSWREPLRGGTALADRLRAAARIAETESGLAGGSRTQRLAGLAAVLLGEVCKLPLRLIPSLGRS